MVIWSEVVILKRKNKNDFVKFELVVDFFYQVGVFPFMVTTRNR